MTIGRRIKLRRDTAANWASANPVLMDGEIGYVKDSKDFKVGDGTTAWNSLGTPLSATFELGSTKRIYVSPNGDDANSGKTMSSAKLTLVAALTAMGAGVKGTIVMDAGIISAGSGVSWAGYKCDLQGPGPQACFVTATSQSGPVLDLTGGAAYTLNAVNFGGFTIVGDNTAGATKKGLALPSSYSVGYSHFHDIIVKSTGGAPFDLGIAELCEFSRLTAYDPVSVVANDVPYFTAAGAFNGNTLRDCKVTSQVATGTGNAGPTGAVVITDDGAQSPTTNEWSAFKVENLHLGNNGTIFNVKGNAQIFSGTQFFDCSKTSAGVTGTSHFKFANAFLNIGGNIVQGTIPGKGTSTTDIDCGVDCRQSYNRFEGIKGFKGYNVILASGVGFTYVHLKGSISGASDPGWTDSSGQTTNHLVDEYLQLDVRPSAWNSGSPSATDIQDFAANGTWTKPTTGTPKMVHVRLWASGGGGGAGACQPSGTLATGGGGGGGGAYTERWYKAADLAATVAVTVAAAGAGGTPVSATGVGGAGGVGNNSSFGTSTTYGAVALAGGGGGGGTAAGAGSAGFGQAGGTASGTGGVASSATGLLGNAAAGGFAGSGGGSGGGITTGAAASAGGAGGVIAGGFAAASAGGATGATGTAGTAFPVGSGPGSGGGGGGSSVSGAAGAGGAGGTYGGGGGGGGSSLNGSLSGAGGAGGAGRVIVETYF